MNFYFFHNVLKSLLPRAIEHHFQQHFGYIASATIHAFLEFFRPVLGTILFPKHWLFSHLTIVETTDGGERGMNPVTMTIIILRKNIGRAWDQTSDLLFSSLQRHQLSYGARLRAIESLHCAVKG